MKGPAPGCTGGTNTRGDVRRRGARGHGADQTDPSARVVSRLPALVRLLFGRGGRRGRPRRSDPAGLPRGRRDRVVGHGRAVSRDGRHGLRDARIVRGGLDRDDGGDDAAVGAAARVRVRPAIRGAAEMARGDPSARGDVPVDLAHVRDRVLRHPGLDAHVLARSSLRGSARALVGRPLRTDSDEASERGEVPGAVCPPRAPPVQPHAKRRGRGREIRPELRRMRRRCDGRDGGRRDGEPRLDRGVERGGARVQARARAEHAADAAAFGGPVRARGRLRPDAVSHGRGMTWERRAIPGGGHLVLALAADTDVAYAVVSPCRLNQLCGSPLTLWRTKPGRTSWSQVSLTLPRFAGFNEVVLALHGDVAYVSIPRPTATQPDVFDATTDARNWESLPNPCTY